MRPAHRILSNKHISLATGLWSIRELKQRKGVKRNAGRHVRKARQGGAKFALEMRGAAASETQMFAGYWATSQGRRIKSGPIEKLDSRRNRINNLKCRFGNP